MTKTKKARTLVLKDNEITCFKCEERCLHEIQHKTPGEEPIECDSCSHWFHRHCLDQTILQKDWQSLTGENQSVMFKCLSCLQGKGEKVSELREIKEMIRSNQEMIKGLNEKINKQIDSKLADVNSKQKAIEERLNETDKKNEERFSKIENELKNKQHNKSEEEKNDPSQQELQTIIHKIRDTEIDMESKIKDEVKMYLDQQHDKDKRKNNLIIHRLEETQADKKEQLQRDKTDVLKIFATTNPELISEIQESILEGNKITRLGSKKPGATKPRPIRVVLNDEEMKWDILKGCKNLKDSIFSNISVQTDLSIEEQKANYKLRQELKKRKDEGEKVCIYRGEIIPEEERPKKDDN